jgi:SnoaL-like polyketide cyclase
VSARDNEPVIRRAIEAIWNRGELDVADELFAPDYVHHGGLIPDLVHGPEAIKISVVLYRRAFADLHIMVEELSAKGETVVLHWSAWRQSHGGPGPGATHTASQSLLSGITRSRFSGGKIMESWTEWDGLPQVRESDLISTD